MAKRLVAPKQSPSKNAGLTNINTTMRAGFMKNEAANRPVFLYIDGTIAGNEAVTISEVFFKADGLTGLITQYDVDNLDVRPGFIKLKVKTKKASGAKATPHKPLAGPTSGVFTVTLSINSLPSTTCYLAALLYPE